MSRPLPWVCVLVVFVLLSVGCGAWVTSPTVVLGGYAAEPSQQTFESLLEASREAGYPPEQVDLDRGRFVVASQRAGGYDVRFEVQCYRGGWVQLRPRGEHVTTRGDQHRLPSGARDELDDYVQRLAAIRPEAP